MPTTTSRTPVKHRYDGTIDPVQAKLLDRKLIGVARQQPDFAALAVRLVAIGGWHVASGLEEDLEALLTRGEERTPERVVLREGEPCRCHGNAARLREAEPRKQIVTGWALSDDGLWRQHTWCELDGTLIETTLTRERYFGFPLDDNEAATFCDENW
jgi:hypothetical protein